jgi:protein-S-isoprenylcysteine O-methyltransferase Ste14
MILRIRKLTSKLILVYILAVILVISARPEFKPYLFLGLGLILLGAGIRLWAAGHLIKNKVLTTTGPYAYVKNPLYIGTFLIMIGFCIMAKGEYGLNWFVLGFGVLLFLVYYIPYKKKVEAQRLKRRHQDLWEEYNRMVPDYIPNFRPFRKGSQRWSLRIFLENSEHWTMLAITAGILAIIFNQQLISLF